MSKINFEHYEIYLKGNRQAKETYIDLCRKSDFPGI